MFIKLSIILINYFNAEQPHFRKSIFLKNPFIIMPGGNLKFMVQAMKSFLYGVYKEHIRRD